MTGLLFLSLVGVVLAYLAASKPARTRVCAFVDKKPALFFALWAIWLCLPYWIAGDRSYVRVHDNGDSLIAYRHFIHFLDKVPQWLNIGMGVDLWTSNEFMVLDPFYLFHGLRLPIWVTLLSVLFLQRFLGSYFLYKLLTRELKIEILPAVIVAMGYVLFYNFKWGSRMIFADGLLLPAFPMAIWWCYQTAKSFSPKNVAALVGTGVLLAGVSVLVIGVYGLIPVAILPFLLKKGEVDRKKYLAAVAIFVAACVATWLPLLYRTIQGSVDSHRFQWTQPILTAQILKDAMIMDFNLVQVFWLVYLLFAIAVILSLWLRQSFWPLALAVVVTTFPSVAQILAGVLSEYIPPLRWIYIARVRLASFNPFFIWVFVALALNALVRSDRFERLTGAFKRIPEVVCLLLLLVVLERAYSVNHFMMFTMAGGMNFKTYYRDERLQEFAATRKHNPNTRCVTSLLRNNAMEMAYGLETADGYFNNYPSHYFEYWKLLLEPLRNKNTAEILDYFGNFGHRIYYYAPNGKDSMPPSERTYSLNMLAAIGVNCLITDFEIVDADYKLFQRIPNNYDQSGRYIGFKFLWNYLKGFTPFHAYDIYLNEMALPRFYIAPSAEVLATEHDVLIKMRDVSPPDLRNKVYFDRAMAPPHIPSGDAKQFERSVDVEYYSQDEVVLAARSNQEGVLVHNTNFSKFWQVEIDGQRAELYRVNFVVQGVLVPAGKHQIRFKYVPPDLMSRL